jgi:hypothetical protein
MNTHRPHDFGISAHFDSFELHFLKAGRFYMSKEHPSPGFQSIPPAQSIIEQHLYCNKHGRLLFWNIATARPTEHSCRDEKSV